MDFALVGLLVIIILILSQKIRNRLAKWYVLGIMLFIISLLFVSVFNPFNLFPVSLEVYFLSFIGYMSFFLGYLSPKYHSYSIHESVNTYESVEYILSKKSIEIFYIGCLSLLLYVALTQWRLIIFQGGMGNLKLEFFDLVFGGNSILFFLYLSILTPLFHLSCVVLSMMVVNRMFNIKSIFIFIYVFLFCFIGGKRGYYAICLQYFVLIFLFDRLTLTTKRNRNPKASIFRFALVASVFFVGAAMMTSVGHTGTEIDNDDVKSSMMEISENFVKYQIGPYRALDYAISNNYVDKYGGYTLGRATMGGMVDYYLCAILSRIGIPSTPVRALAMSPLQDNTIYIGKETPWNFSYTSFYYFLFDMGWIGVALFSFLFGYFVRFVLILYQRRNTLGLLALSCYLFVACLNFSGSWINIDLSAQPVVILFLLLSRFEFKRINRSKIIKNIA